jgi:hypothetical protein
MSRLSLKQWLKRKAVLRPYVWVRLTPVEVMFDETFDHVLRLALVHGGLGPKGLLTNADLALPYMVNPDFASARAGQPI